jgi:hypothetical protein
MNLNLNTLNSAKADIKHPVIRNQLSRIEQHKQFEFHSDQDMFRFLFNELEELIQTPTAIRINLPKHCEVNMVPSSLTVAEMHPHQNFLFNGVTPSFTFSYENGSRLHVKYDLEPEME